MNRHNSPFCAPLMAFFVGALIVGCGGTGSEGGGVTSAGTGGTIGLTTGTSGTSGTGSNSTSTGTTTGTTGTTGTTTTGGSTNGDMIGPGNNPFRGIYVDGQWDNLRYFGGPFQASGIIHGDGMFEILLVGKSKQYGKINFDGLLSRDYNFAGKPLSNEFPYSYVKWISWPNSVQPVQFNIWNSDGEHWVITLFREQHD